MHKEVKVSWNGKAVASYKTKDAFIADHKDHYPKEKLGEVYDRYTKKDEPAKEK